MTWIEFAKFIHRDLTARDRNTLVDLVGTRRHSTGDHNHRMTLTINKPAARNFEHLLLETSNLTRGFLQGLFFDDVSNLAHSPSKCALNFRRRETLRIFSNPPNSVE